MTEQNKPHLPGHPDYIDVTIEVAGANAIIFITCTDPKKAFAAVADWIRENDHFRIHTFLQGAGDVSHPLMNQPMTINTVTAILKRGGMDEWADYNYNLSDKVGGI